MAVTTVTISQLSAATTISSTDLMAVEQSGVLKAASVGSILGEFTEVTTGASDETITLPDLASSLGREIRIYKVDDGAGQVIIEAAGSDTITRAGLTQVTLTSEGDFWGLRALTGKWELFEGVDSFESSTGKYKKFSDGRMDQSVYSSTQEIPITSEGALNYTYLVSFVSSQVYITGFMGRINTSWTGFKIITAYVSATTPLTVGTLFFENTSVVQDFVESGLSATGRWYA